MLDDYSMLRQLTPAIASEPAHLFKPGDAVRVRRNVGADTPFPPEVPHALNPPAGVIIDYWLAQAPSRDITLDVLDAAGAVGAAPLERADRAGAGSGAAAASELLGRAADRRCPQTPGRIARTGISATTRRPRSRHSFEINANPGLTPPSPEGPLALPGVYTLKLTVDGRSYTQTVRSPTTRARRRRSRPCARSTRCR